MTVLFFQSGLKPFCIFALTLATAAAFAQPEERLEAVPDPGAAYGRAVAAVDQATAKISDSSKKSVGLVKDELKEAKALLRSKAQALRDESDEDGDDSNV